MTTNERVEIELCSCCFIVLCNGDDSGCRDYYGHDDHALNNITDGYHVVPGGPHSEECDDQHPETPDSRGRDCECDDLGFRTTPCDGCGDSDHGDRYQATLFK